MPSLSFILPRLLTYLYQIITIHNITNCSPSPRSRTWFTTSNFSTPQRHQHHRHVPRRKTKTALKLSMSWGLWHGLLHFFDFILRNLNSDIRQKWVGYVLVWKKTDYMIANEKRENTWKSRENNLTPNKQMIIYDNFILEAIAWLDDDISTAATVSASVLRCICHVPLAEPNSIKNKNKKTCLMSLMS